MNFNRIFLLIGLSLSAILISFNSSASSEKEKQGQNTVNKTSQTTERAQTKTPDILKSSHSNADADTVRLEITGDDKMQFNKEEMRVKTGQVVVLTLKHVGEMAKSAMGHNWVLLKQGVDMASFATDAIMAKDNGYIPPNRADEVIAHTKMLGGGESDTIIFKAPPKGTYTFLCSFPGHYSTMNGKFIVE